MLYLYIIILLVSSAAIYIKVVKKPLAYITDSIYDYPEKSSFRHQNCQLDKSCWIKNSDITPLTNSRFNRNMFYVGNRMKGPAMPKLFFQPKFGSNKTI
jgi:hypothetical protein